MSFSTILNAFENSAVSNAMGASIGQDTGADAAMAQRTLADYGTYQDLIEQLESLALMRREGWCSDQDAVTNMQALFKIAVNAGCIDAGVLALLTENQSALNAIQNVTESLKERVKSLNLKSDRVYKEMR